MKFESEFEIFSQRGGARAGGPWQCAHSLPPCEELPGERETRQTRNRNLKP